MNWLKTCRARGALSFPAVVVIAVLLIIVVPTILRMVIGAVFTLLHLAITVATLIIIFLLLLGVIRFLNKRV
jgi:hypothetical protein